MTKEFARLHFKYRNIEKGFRFRFNLPLQSAMGGEIARLGEMTLTKERGGKESERDTGGTAREMKRGKEEKNTRRNTPARDTEGEREREREKERERVVVGRMWQSWSAAGNGLSSISI